MPQGAAGRGFSEKSGRQGKVREEVEQRDVSDHRACVLTAGEIGHLLWLPREVAA